LADDDFTNNKVQGEENASEQEPSEEDEFLKLLQEAGLLPDDAEELQGELDGEADEQGEVDELILELRKVPDWFMETGRLGNNKPFSDTHKQIYSLAQKFNSVKRIAHKLHISPSDVKRRIYSILRSWDRYQASLGKKKEEEEMAEKKEGAEPMSEPEAEIEPEPVEEPPEPPKRERGRPRKPPSDSGKEEKITPTLYTKSANTTTFKEIDKTVAEVLGQTFHRYAVEREVYARLGELLIFSLLQLGVVTRDDIVRYSEKLIEDPNALYEYIRHQLDAVLRVTDPDALMKTWQENMLLRRRVRVLQATADMLADTLKEYEEALRFLIGLLNKKQLEKLATYVFMKEALQEWGVLTAEQGGGAVE